jgi:hypothetical protein
MEKTLYSNWLEDNSLIIFRKKGTMRWYKAFVLDDRVYFPETDRVNDGEVHHVTKTTKGSIDFGIYKNGLNCEVRPYEVLTSAMIEIE